MAHKKPKKSGRRASAGTGMPPMMRDPRAMEKTMRDLTRLLEQQDFASPEEANAFLGQFIGSKDIPAPEPETPLERAQEKVYEAFGATGKRRAQLAKEALEISPDCADAYVLLAEETARTPEEALKLYEQGMRAGERALGPEIFEEAAGQFWGIMETRPYMRARAGVAECLWAIGERRQAIAHYREMLRLNPGDNQGNRYMLLRLLLKEGLDEEAGKLLDQYKDEGSAEWAYARALLMFRRRGAGYRAKARLKKAFESNPFVPLFLSGLKEPPRELPPYIGLGDENEAIHYFYNYAQMWLDTPGALQWFAEVFSDVLRDFEKDEGLFRS